jgi:predicted enzyme related to lactoylglutathione lyase
MRGSVVHFEIPADDLERASGFYQEAFGWQLTPMPEMEYTAIATTPIGPDGVPTEAGAINGGMFARNQPLTTPVVTVDVDDVDAALAKVEQLGGKTVAGRQAVPGMGYSAYFKDPEGNILGLWQSASDA